MTLMKSSRKPIRPEPNARNSTSIPAAICCWPSTSGIWPRKMPQTSPNVSRMPKMNPSPPMVGGTILFVMPGGAFLPDGLPKMQPVQGRDQQPAGHGGDHKAPQGSRRQQIGDSLLHAVIPPKHSSFRRGCAGKRSRLRQSCVIILQQLLQLHRMAGLGQKCIAGLYKLP